MPADREEGSWREIGFVAPHKEALDELYWVDEIFSWQGSNDEEDAWLFPIAAVAYGSSLYQLLDVYVSDGDQQVWDHYLLECWNPATGSRVLSSL